MPTEPQKWTPEQERQAEHLQALLDAYHARRATTLEQDVQKAESEVK